MVLCATMSWSYTVSTALLVGLVAIIPDPARAFSVDLSSSQVVARWEDPAIQYYLQYEGSDDLGSEESMLAIYRAFQSWMDVPCTNVTMTDVGDAPDPMTNLLAGASPNGKNELVWIEDDTWTLGSSVLGVTAPLRGMDGYIYEADIAFNGYLLTFKNEGPGTDLESVAVHEIGHLMGIQHNIGPYSWQNPPTMAPSIANKNKSRSLEEDDEMAVCFLYPVDGSWACESDDMCPKVLGTNPSDGEDYYAGEFLCEEGLCAAADIFISDAIGLGEACENDVECAGDLYCQPWQDAGVCTNYCVVDEPNCAEGFECTPFQSYPVYGACLPESGEIMAPGTGPEGCQDSSICPDGMFCLPTPTGEKKACVHICDINVPDSCPDDLICWSYGNDSGGCFDANALPPGNEGPDDDPEVGPESSPDAESDAGSSDTGTQGESDASVSSDLGEGGSPEVPGPGTGDESKDNGCSSQDSRGPWALMFALLSMAAWIRSRRWVEGATG